MLTSGRFLISTTTVLALAVWLTVGYVVVDQQYPDLIPELGQVLPAIVTVIPTPTPCVPNCPSYQCGGSADCGCGVTYTPPGCPNSDYSCSGNSCVCNPPPSCPGGAQCGSVGNSCDNRSCGSGSDQGLWTKGCSTTFVDDNPNEAPFNGFSCTVEGSRSCQGGGLTWSGCSASNVCADNGYECNRPPQCINGGDGCGTCEEAGDSQTNPTDEQCVNYRCVGKVPAPPRNLQFNLNGEYDQPVKACGAVPLTFQWQEPASTQYLDAYVLQVDDDPNFGSPIFSDEVLGTDKTVTLAPGNWYWQVASRNIFYQNGERRTADSGFVKWEP